MIGRGLIPLVSAGASVVALSGDVNGDSNANHVDSITPTSGTVTVTGNVSFEQSTAYTIGQAQRTGDNAARSLTIAAQTPSATATGANRNSPSISLSIPAPTAGGSYGAVSFAFGGTTLAAFGRDTTYGHGFVRLLDGSGNTAQSGCVRIPNARWIVGRNGAASGDVEAIRVDNNDVVDIGGTGALKVQHFGQTFQWQNETQSWGPAVSSPRLEVQTPTGDSAPVALTIAGQSPYTSATGANRTPGDLRLSIGSPTNGGTTDGAISLRWRSTERIKFGYDGTYPFTSFGAQPSTATATVRLSSAGGGADTVLLSVRNNANSGNISILRHVGSNDEIRLGDTTGDTTNTISVNPSTSFVSRISGTSRLALTASELQVACTTQITATPPLFTFVSTASSPRIDQTTRASDAAPQSLTIRAQAPFATATGANRTPGDLLLESPSPTNGGTTYGRVALKSDGTEILVADKDSSGVARLRLNLSTSATAGAAGDYLVVNVNGTNLKIPTYAMS